MVVHFQDEYEHAAALKENSENLDFSETPECGQCHKEDPKVCPPWNGNQAFILRVFTVSFMRGLFGELL